MEKYRVLCYNILQSLEYTDDQLKIVDSIDAKASSVFQEMKSLALL